MGTYTDVLSGGEMSRLVKLGLMAECDNVTEDTEIRIRRSQRHPYDFIVVLNGDEIDGNEEEWAKKERKEVWAWLKGFGIMVLWMVSALGVAMVAGVYGIPYLISNGYMPS